MARLAGPPATLVGIDHGFSFPLIYFEKYKLPHDWPSFLDDFQKNWPTDEDNTPVDFVREGVCGDAGARCGDSRWRRITEIRAGAKSVFHFDAPGSVAKSTHASILWLRFLRKRVGDRVHFWPFDGWEIPGKSGAVEVYPGCGATASAAMAATPISKMPMPLQSGSAGVTWMVVSNVSSALA